MTTSTDQKQTPDETAQSDRFQLSEPIGRGGMATVYRAYDNAAEMDVAVKLLHGHLADDEGMVEAFEREAALMQRIDHPGVVRVFSTEQFDARPAIVMQLCEGGDLSERLTRRDTLPEDEVLEIGLALLDALAACHELGIIHRDVKPHNVMFDADDNPKLIDFGIGQAEELMAADESGQLGTVEYMAPERVDGLAVDARSDLYSMGILLFELLCGHPPYRADSASAVMRMHRDADVADPRAFTDEIRNHVADALMQAMAKHPEQRFDSAEQFADALRGDIEDRPPIPDHPTWEALQQQFGDHFELAAPLQTHAQEWVVFVPPRFLSDDDAAKANFDLLVRELIDDYHDYLAVKPKRLSGVPAADVLQRFGLARGLSRQGAYQLHKRLDDAGVLARIAQRPRSHREEPGWKRRFSGLDVVNAALTAVIWTPLLILFFLAALNVTPYAPVIAPLLVVAALFAGIATGWIAIGDRFREWWLAAVCRSYLFDFCRNRAALKTDGAIGGEHFELLEQLQSPRLAASFRRATNMALHLRERTPHTDDIDRVITLITELATRIAEAEAAVAAVRPAELTAQIRRIDRRISTADDIDTVEPLMDQKAALREQLTERDDAQQRLQQLGQQLHELAARLEDLVHQHRRDPDEQSETDADEVVFDFDSLAAKLDAVEQSQVERRTSEAGAA